MIIKIKTDKGEDFSNTGSESYKIAGKDKKVVINISKEDNKVGIVLDKDKKKFQILF